MTTISQIFDAWLGTANSLGISDDLRCIAMECLDDYPEITVKEYVAEAVLRGYNPTTARGCWNHVKRQEK